MAVDDQTSAMSTGSTSSAGDDDIITVSETTADMKDTMTETTMGKPTEDQEEGATTERDTDLEEKVVLSDTTEEKEESATQEMTGGAEGEEGEGKVTVSGEGGETEVVKDGDKRASEAERVRTLHVLNSISGKFLLV